MSDVISKSAVESRSADPRAENWNEIRAHLKKLDQKQWWMWSSAVLVILLLTVGVASFAFPSLLHVDEGTYSFFLSQSVRGLVGLVLLFSVYTIYQQFQINRIRTQLADQMDSVAKVEVLTEEVYKLAVLDPLTGLHNRRSGEQRLSEEIALDAARAAADSDSGGPRRPEELQRQVRARGRGRDVARIRGPAQARHPRFRSCRTAGRRRVHGDSAGMPRG